MGVRSRVVEIEHSSHVKVRLRWFWVVLQCPRKFVLFPFSIDTIRIILYHEVAKEECYTVI